MYSVLYGKSIIPSRKWTGRNCIMGKRKHSSFNCQKKWEYALQSSSPVFILAYLNIFVGKKRQKKSFLIPVKFTMCLAFSTTPSQLGFLTSSVGQWALPEVDMWLVTWSMPTPRSHLVEFRGLISSSCCVMWTDWFTVHESLSSISVNLLVKCMMIALRVRL